MKQLPGTLIHMVFNVMEKKDISTIYQREEKKIKGNKNCRLKSVASKGWLMDRFFS